LAEDGEWSGGIRTIMRDRLGLEITYPLSGTVILQHVPVPEGNQGSVEEQSWLSSSYNTSRSGLPDQELAPGRRHGIFCRYGNGGV